MTTVEPNPPHELEKKQSEQVASAPQFTTTNQIVERMRTFTITRWCGMPAELNPRKLAKKGFILSP